MTAIIPPKHKYQQNTLNNLPFCKCGVAKHLHPNQPIMKTHKEQTIEEKRVEILKWMKAYIPDGKTIPDLEDMLDEYDQERDRIAREEERHLCMDLISDCQQEHNVARHGEDYDTAYDRAIDCLNPALTTPLEDPN